MAQAKWNCNTYSTAECEECVCNLWDVFLFEKVDSLEYILIWNTVFFQCFLEVVDIFHHFELATSIVDFRNQAWFDFVDQLAANLSVLEYIFVQLVGWEFEAKNGFDPLLSFFVLFWITFASNLIAFTPNRRKKGKENTNPLISTVTSIFFFKFTMHKTTATHKLIYRFNWLKI